MVLYILKTVRDFYSEKYKLKPCPIDQSTKKNIPLLVKLSPEEIINAGLISATLAAIQLTGTSRVKGLVKLNEMIKYFEGK